MNIIVESHIPHMAGRLEPYGQVAYLDAADITADAVRDADVLLVRTRTRCDAHLLAGSRVKFIGTATIGTDHIDLDYCRRQGITVRNAPGCNAPAVAQWVFAAIGTWMQRRGIASPAGLTLGVVGVGHIGSIVARWGRQLGFDVVLNDPPRAEGGEAVGGPDVVFSSLADVQRRCDIITFHTPLTPRGKQHPTWHLCDTQLLAGLRHCGLLLNASRGAVADNAALASWQGGDIAIDCWENEPHIMTDLLKKCVVATPHIAGYSLEGKQRATAMLLAALNDHYGWQLALPTIAAPATGASQVSLGGIMDSYDIAADTEALRHDPSQFERLRNTYPLRHEVV